MVSQRLELDIATEFTITPGPRKRDEGDFSGEQFLEELLRPKYLEAVKNAATLQVNLDGAVGYPSSFLEEAFGGLAREFGGDNVQRVLQFTSHDEPYLIDQLQKFIRDAKLIK